MVSQVKLRFCVVPVALHCRVSLPQPGVMVSDQDLWVGLGILVCSGAGGDERILLDEQAEHREYGVVKILCMRP